MLNVAHILQAKPEQTVYTIAPDQTVLAALTLMADKGIGAVIVMDRDEVVGILSERDYARKVALMERSSQDTRVADIMTSKVLTVERKTSIDACLTLMTERHLRHLPVVENSQLVGLVSIGDLVKGVIEQQKAHIDQLQNYISN